MRAVMIDTKIHSRLVERQADQPRAYANARHMGCVNVVRKGCPPADRHFLGMGFERCSCSCAEDWDAKASDSRPRRGLACASC
jgi:hypothetical protein